jgi:hypothetical protein
MDDQPGGPAPPVPEPRPHCLSEKTPTRQSNLYMVFPIGSGHKGVSETLTLIKLRVDLDRAAPLENEMRSRSQQLQPSSIKGNPAAACGLTGGAALQTVSRLAGIHSTPASRPGVITDSRAHRELRQR